MIRKCLRMCAQEANGLAPDPGPTAHSPKTLGTLLHVWCLSFLICVTGDKSHTHLTGLLGRFTVDFKRVSNTWPEKNKRQLLA